MFQVVALDEAGDVSIAVGKIGAVQGEVGEGEGLDDVGEGEGLDDVSMLPYGSGGLVVRRG